MQDKHHPKIFYTLLNLNRSYCLFNISIEKRFSASEDNMLFLTKKNTHQLSK